jgi:hypothetical protein
MIQPAAIKDGFLVVSAARGSAELKAHAKMNARAVDRFVGESDDERTG